MEQHQIEIPEEKKRKESIIIAIAVGIIIVCVVMAIIFSSFYPIIFAPILELILFILSRLPFAHTAEDTARILAINRENTRQF